MRIVAIALLLLLMLPGCSRKFTSDEMRFSIDVPKGHSTPTIQKVVAQNGNRSVADFGGGLHIIRVDAPLPELGSVPHDELALQGLLRLPPGALQVQTITSRREGTIGSVKVLRFDLKDGNARGLLYIVPRTGHFFVVSAASDAADASTRLDRLEGALGTLKFQD